MSRRAARTRAHPPSACSSRACSGSTRTSAGRASWPRSIITLQLEQKLSKQEIFEYYANQVDLGWRGTFHILGFGQAAEAYLGKDLSQINLPEAAATRRHDPAARLLRPVPPSRPR